MPAFHRESWQLFLRRTEVWVVVGCPWVCCSLPDVCADKRLVVELEAHTVGRTSAASLHFVVVRPRILVAFRHVPSQRGSKAPGGRFGLSNDIVRVICVGRRVVAPALSPFFFSANSCANSPPWISFNVLRKHRRILAWARIEAGGRLRGTQLACKSPTLTL